MTYYDFGWCFGSRRRWHHHHFDRDIETALYPVEQPDGMLVSLDDMKAHVKVDWTDENTLIEAFIQAVSNYLDGPQGELQRALQDQTWDFALSAFPAGPIPLPLPPLVAVESIKYYDADNVQQTLDPSIYEVVGAGGSKPAEIVTVLGQRWPVVYSRAEPVTVRFRAGYLTSDSPPAPNVPKAIIAAAKLLVANLYDNRESIVVGTRAQAIEIPWSAAQLLRPYRIYN